MMRDEYGYCVVCYSDPCRCFSPGRPETCQSCRMLREEIAALRRELQKARATVAAIEIQTRPAGSLKHR